MAAAAPSPTTLRLRAALLSLVIGALLLAIKLGAWALTGSTAVLSDALESIVNVIAAGFAVYSVHLSRKPPDLDHPYGHGKIEFLSAGFEGGLIFVAGGLIIFEATRRLLVGVALARLSEGIGLVAFAAVVNLILGLYLIRTGKKTHSLTLVADGKHLLTDVYTSAATAAALAVVLLTGWRWIDPAFAIVAALNILRIGLGLMREAVGGIMDEADPEDLKIVAEALAHLDDPLFVGWSQLRSRHQGALHHVDLTVYVPDETAVAAGHALADRVERTIASALGEAEVICHVEPESLRRRLDEALAVRPRAEARP